jgi:hypothetical protein
MYFLTTELELTILGVASIGAMLLLAALIAINKVIVTNKMIAQNQQKQNELLLTMANVLGSKSEEEIRKFKQENSRSEKSADQK